MNDPQGTHGPAVSPGHLIGGGHYSLHVPLGDKGLTWLAQDEHAQRLAAIRFLPAEISQDPRALRILRTRVEAAQSVQQENLCRILELYESPGVETFVATEYIEGKGVWDALCGGATEPIPWERIMPVAASMACALFTLHRAGVTHHAIKPENVMIATDKRVKLLNTVVAGVLRNPLLVPSVLSDPAALRCLSPQQLSGEDPAPADDYYSLGATLFEFLTGTPVFRNPSSLLQDIRSTAPDSLLRRLEEVQARGEVPAHIVEFITASLSKNPGDRPKSLDCLLPQSSIPSVPKEAAPAAAVEPVGNPPSGISTAVPVASELQVIHHARPIRRKSRAPVMAFAAVLIVGALTAGAWFVMQQQNSRKEVDAAAAAEQAEREKQLMEEKLKEETAARLRLEEEARKAQARLAAIAEEKRRLEQEEKAREAKERLASKESSSQPPPKPGAPPKPTSSTNGFVVMFNGQDLTGWSGDTNFWSVRDGAITAQSPSDAPKRRHLLVWQKGSVSDFEMHFSYRFRVLRGNRQPNGGVNYRLTGETNLVCYQFDLVTHTRDLGSVSDDRKRSRLAGYGESVIATASGTNKVELLATVGDTNKINAIRHEDWNKCVIIAKGNRLTHYINGIMVADVTDLNKRRHTQGLIALELYTRNTNNASTFLQFRDLAIKKSSGGNSSLASAGAR